MIDVLSGLCRELETAFGKPIRDADINAAICEYNQIRKQLKALYALRSQDPGLFAPSAVHWIMTAAISSICTVFAESEVISLISRGESRQNMIAGIHESVASRISAMARRVGVTTPVMMTGGVARNQGVVRALESRMDVEIRVSPHAQLNGAIGAALLAVRMQKQ